MSAPEYRLVTETPLRRGGPGPLCRDSRVCREERILSGREEAERLAPRANGWDTWVEVRQPGGLWEDFRA